MRFPGFYGNSALKMRLSAAEQGGGLSHCYVLSGPTGSGKKTLARILAAAMECTGHEQKPCGQCPNCHKIFGEGHPDVIWVDSEKATLPIRVIREKLVEDAYILPNEGQRKIYISPRAQDMQPVAQNALLKILEEPPAYCSFLLLTDASEKLLNTIRSRAVELSLFPLSQNELISHLKSEFPSADDHTLASAANVSGGYLGSAMELLRNPAELSDPILPELCTAFASGEELALLEVLIPLEKRSRPEVQRVVELFYAALVQAMHLQADPGVISTREAVLLAEGCSPQRLFEASGVISRVITLLQANGSPGHSIGLMLAGLPIINQTERS